MRKVPACLLFTVAVAVVACGREGPTAPPPSTERPAVPLALQPLSVVDGFDGHGIAFAEVIVDYESHSTDANGSVQLGDSYSSAATGALVAVAAEGYLPRVTLLEPDRRITLWPAAGGKDGEEGDAIRRMVFGAAGVHEPRASRVVSLSLEAPPEVRDAWLAEAQQFGRALGIDYQVSPHGDDEAENVLVVRFAGDRAGCMPDETTGYCRDSDRRFAVSERKARDPRTMRRVFAAWFLRPNPLPGLMNADDPAGELSPLELRTIRMVLLRPRRTLWPDNDR